jgi:hypothetical protein
MPDTSHCCCPSPGEACVLVYGCGTVPGDLVDITGPDSFSASGTTTPDGVYGTPRFCFTPGGAGSYSVTVTPLAGSHRQVTTASFIYSSGSPTWTVEVDPEEGWACFCCANLIQKDGPLTVTAWGQTKTMGPASVYVESPVGAFVTLNHVACFEVTINPDDGPPDGRCGRPAIGDGPYCNAATEPFTVPVLVAINYWSQANRCHLVAQMPALNASAYDSGFMRTDMGCSDYPWTTPHPCGIPGLVISDWISLTQDCSSEQFRASVSFGGGSDASFAYEYQQSWCLLPATTISIQGPT